MALDDILVTVGADISDYVKGLDRASKATRDFEGGLKSSDGTIKSHNKTLGSSASVIDKGGKAYESYTSSLDKSRSSIQSQGVDLKAADKAYASYMGSVQKAGGATKDIGTEFKEGVKVSQEYTESLESTGRAGMIAASSLQTASTVITVALGALIMAASRFEDAFIGVEKVLSGTPEQFAELESEIRGLSKELPRSAAEIAGVAEEAGRLGIKKDDISKFTKTMVQMGDASDLSASEAAKSMARFMNIMHTGEGDVHRLGSAITHLGNNVAASESEILDLSRRLAGSAQQIGLTEAEVIGLAGSMSELGIRSEMGGTAMQKTFLTMNSAVMEGGAKLDAFAGVAGQTADEFKNSFEQDAKGAIISFISGLDEVGKSGGDVSSVLAELGLNNERTKDTLLRLSSAHESLAANMDLTTDAWNKGTALQEEADNRYESLSSTLKILLNRVMDLVLILGQPLMSAFKILLDIFEPFLYAVESAVGMFDKLSDGTKTTIAFLALLVPIILSAAAAVIAVNGAIKIFTAATAAGAAGAGVFSGAMTLLTGPVGLAVVGLGALAAGVVWVVGWFKKASEEEKKFAEETSELAEATAGLNDELKQSSSAYGDTINDLSAGSKAYQTMADDIVDLASKENKSASEKALLKGKIEELNGSVEGLNLSYNDQADSLNHSSEAIKDRINYLEQEGKLVAAQERMVEISKERNKADLQIEEINAHREKLNELVEKNGKVSKDTKEKIEELDEAEEGLKETHENLGIQFEVVSKQVTEAQAAVDKAVSEGVKNMTLSYENLTDSQKEMTGDLISRYEALADAATDMFDKISTESKVSFEEMKENMQHNADMVRDWGENLATLVDWGVDKGLIERLREAGPESAAEVQAIVDAGEAEAKELGGIYDGGLDEAEAALLSGLEGMDEQSQGLISAIVRGMSTTFADDMDAANFKQYSKEAMEKVDAGITEQESNILSSVTDVVKNAIKNPFFKDLKVSDFKSHGVNVMEGAAEGLASMKDTLSSVISDLTGTLDDVTTDDLEINSPSRLFFRHGSDVMEGFVGGLDSGKGDLIGSITDIFDDMLVKTTGGLVKVEERSKMGVKTIGNIFGKLPASVNGSMVSMTDRLQSQGALQVKYMGTLPGSLTKPFGSFTKSMTSIGSNAMLGLGKGLSSKVGGIMSKAQGIANSVVGTIKGALRIHSPSKVAIELMRFFGDGMIEGMDDSISPIVKMAERITEAATPDQPKLAEFGVDEFKRKSWNIPTKAQVNYSEEFKMGDSGDYSGLLEEIRDELRNRGDLIVQMDSKEVGRAVSHTVDESIKNQVDKRRNAWGG